MLLNKTSLCDFAADVRAPTPSAAAEIAVPVRAELLARLQTISGRALRCVQRYRERAGERLDATVRHLPTPETLLGPQSQRVDELSDRLKRGLSHVVAEARGELAQAAGALRRGERPDLLHGRRLSEVARGKGNSSSETKKEEINFSRNTNMI